MTATATFPRQNWDLDLRAELYKQELYATSAWRSERDDWVTPWDDGRPAKELTDLLGLMKERPACLGSVIRERQSRVLIGYWYDWLGFGPKTHPLTDELVHASVHVAGSVAMYFKMKFQRVRPWVLEPRLAPPIVPLPGHPAYPSGHSTQMHLTAHTLAYLVPGGLPDELMERIGSVALNRERAGLNYRSDTEAGRVLAQRLIDTLTTQCRNFASNLATARDGEWR